MKIEGFVAFRYLKSRRKEATISIITIIATAGVALGVAALIVTLSVVNGFENDLRAALIGANYHLTVTNFASNEINETYNNTITDKVLATPEVVRYSPFILKQALLIGKNESAGTLTKGISPQDEMLNQELVMALRDDPRFNIDQDSTEKLSSGGIDILKQLSTKHFYKQRDSNIRQKLDAIILGSILARNLGVEVNDTVVLVPPEGRISPFGAIPRGKKFIVKGLFTSGISGYDEVLSFMDINMAQAVFKMTNQISGLGIYVKDPSNANKILENLSDKLSFPYIIRSWIDDNQNIFSVILIEKYALAIVLTSIILIAAFNIIGTLIMTVNEKRKDIAILKSFGVEEQSILKIFMLQGMVIGSLGTIIGLLLGLSICFAIKNFNLFDIPVGVYVSNKLSVDIDIAQISAILVISFIICFLATILPARNAAKTKPVDILRYE